MSRIQGPSPAPKRSDPIKQAKTPLSPDVSFSSEDAFTSSADDLSVLVALPASARRNYVINLQKSYGNTYVQRLFQSSDNPRSVTHSSMSDSGPEYVWNHAPELANASTEAIRHLLKDNFLSQWAMAKEWLLSTDKWLEMGKPKEDVETKLPFFLKINEKLRDLRNEDTEKLLRQIRDIDLPKEFKDFKGDDLLSWSAAGSKTPTSDIDVNMKGPGSIRAVTLFNQLFKESLGWPYEPGTVFDVNVYAQDFMEKKPFSKESVGGKTALVPAQEVSFGAGAVAGAFAINQDVWSLVKMRRYMTQQEFDKYRTSVVGDKLDPEETQFKEGTNPDVFQRQQQLRSQFADAEAIHHEWQHNMETKLEEIDSDPAYKTLRDNLEQAKAYLQEGQVEETIEMAASNRIYEQKLNDAEMLRNQLRTLRQKPDENAVKIKECGIKLKNALSEAVVYANEAYLTQGGVHFSVIGQQIGKGIAVKTGKKVEVKLTDAELIQSFREQLGDTLKVLEHKARSEVWSAVYEAGKYIDRMCKSAAPLLPNSAIQWFIGLQNIGAKAAELKERQGLKAEERKKAISPLVTIIAGDLSGFRQKLIEFGVEVEKAYQKKSAAAAGRVQLSDSNRQQAETALDLSGRFPDVRALIARFEDF
jgi:hypothetical protein